MGVVSRFRSFRSMAVATSLASVWSLASVDLTFADKKASHERSAEELEAAKEIDGRELFERQWKPGDERSHGGDGLGPMFNEKSCVACHKDGGVGGGGGPREKNALIFTPLVPVRSFALPGEAQKPPFTDEELAHLHPGLKATLSVVLHRFSTTSDYAEWLEERRGHSGRASLVKVDDKRFPGPVAREIETLRSKSDHVPQGGRVDTTFTIVSERNTTPLFGAGALDKLSDRDILSGESARFQEWPEVSGRAVRLQDGRVGRFGWKAQQPTLREFVATACAVELGLEVPDFHQSKDPLNASEEESRGLDLDNAQVTALTMFIAALDKPGVREVLTPVEKKVAAKGLRAFNAVGCAACHSPEIGTLKGAYTDLLIHDMGQQLADTGQYYATPVAPPQNGSPEQGIASVVDRTEWRTPPLWGLRDSAPYMHDGRADTIEEAIAWHGGEANRSIGAYFSLPMPTRSALLAFLNTLVAPKNLRARLEADVADHVTRDSAGEGEPATGSDNFPASETED